MASEASAGYLQIEGQARSSALAVDATVDARFHDRRRGLGWRPLARASSRCLATPSGLVRLLASVPIGPSLGEDERVPYEVLDASAWAVAGLETDGKTEHLWLERPMDPRPWLFKAVTRHGDRRQGEDWVEKAACSLAEVLEVPHASVELARRGDSEGCVVRDVKSHQWQWYSGADLLAGLLGSGFDPRARLATGHRLAHHRNRVGAVRVPFGRRTDVGVRLLRWVPAAGRVDR